MPDPVMPPDVEFRLLADEAPVMIWRSGKSLACEWFNKPWLDFTGRKLEDEIGDGWMQGIHPEDLERCVAVYTAAFERRDAFTTDYRLRRHDGLYRWIRDQGKPFERDGAFAGYFGICLDISDHLETEQRLKAALIERDVLLREVHHRVKNNFQTLMALTRFMRRSAAPGERNLLDVLSLRLSAMALVQKYMHSAEDNLTSMSVRRMLHRLLPEMSETGLAPDLHIVVRGSDFVLPMKANSYLGLAVTEAVMLLSRAGFSALDVTICNDHAGRKILATGNGGDASTLSSDLGLRLARQYAQSAGAELELRVDVNTAMLEFDVSGGLT